MNLDSNGALTWATLIDGDYLMTAPVNPLTGTSLIGTAPAGTDETDTVGWIWRVKDGASTSFTLYAAASSTAEFT